jgi:NAD(P)-dependent dehydrogenase (short-subunit alcohol dehydrogenase family)
MDLANRAVLITGAKRIGLVVARHLAARGADVAIGYFRSPAEADLAVQAIRAAGRRGVAIRADLSNVKDCYRLVATAHDDFGRLDVLVNMASVYVRREFGLLTEEHWDSTLDVDLKGTWACCMAAIPYLKSVSGGRIINFADWVARSGRPRYLGYLPYYVAKAGVIALTEALALELAPHNVLVNCVAPGPIVPPPGTDEDEIRAVERATPLGRWGGADEIAKAVLALIETDFVTGETIRVDGGRHLR